MGYEWDVFISYRRKDIPKRWLEEIFLPLFKDYLEEALGGRKVLIFRDETGIEGGANWRNTIKRALATSKCLVPILIPSYFHSEWCTKEFAVMYNRQLDLGFNSIASPKGLIIPLKIQDGKHFPIKVTEIQILDCNDYYRVGTGVELTGLYVNLQNTLLNWVETVAEAINNAPPWNSLWLEDEHLEVSNEQFLINYPITISQPFL